MGLKVLLSDLTGGMSNYPSHNTNVSNSHLAHSPSFGAKSLSIYPVGQRKHTDGFSNQPFIPPVTWDITDPTASPTFKGFRHDASGGFDYSKYNSLDGTERGGIAITTNRRLEDYRRINRFFGTPQGRSFIDRQMSLQLMNPKINAPQAKPFTSSPANQWTYNMGVNTLAQIMMGGMATAHTKREGMLPFNERGYVKEDKFLENPFYTIPFGSNQVMEQNGNRLIYLLIKISHVYIGKN